MLALEDPPQRRERREILRRRDRPDELGNDAHLDPPRAGVLDQRSFDSVGRAGDEHDVVAVPERLAGEDRVFLGAPGYEARDDVMDERLRHSSSSAPGRLRGFPSYFTSTSVSPRAGAFAPAF